LLLIGEAHAPLEELDIQSEGKLPLQSKEAVAYYPAFYPFVEKVYDYFAFHQVDRDLPLIEDGHHNLVVMDTIIESQTLFYKLFKDCNAINNLLYFNVFINHMSLL